MATLAVEKQVTALWLMVTPCFMIPYRSVKRCTGVLDSNASISPATAPTSSGTAGESKLRNHSADATQSASVKATHSPDAPTTPRLRAA